MSERKKGAGRPRDEAASAALKAAALGLVREKSYAEVSIGDLIRAAGVSRQTLYNRWSSKAELVLEAFFETAGTWAARPDLTGEAPRRDLLEGFLCAVFEHLERDGDSLRGLIAAAQKDAEFRDLFWARFVAPREAMLTEILRDAQARGELGAERDVEMLSGFVHGAFWYRMLNGQPLDPALARAIVAEVFRGG